MKKPNARAFEWSSWVCCATALVRNTPIPGAAETLVRNVDWWQDYEPCKHEPVGPDGEPLYEQVCVALTAWRLAQ